MLGKLFKHECRAMGRVMIPLYLVMIFIAGLFAFNMKIGMSQSARTLLQRFAIVTSFLFFAAVMAVFVVMFIMVVQRFYKNLLGTEGYLMFTLPANTLQHIAGKALSAMLWIVLGILAGVASGFLIVFILSDVPEFIKELQYAWSLVMGDHVKVLQIVMVVIVILLGILESLCKIYAAIALGHQFNSHRLLMSIIAFIAFGIAEIALTSLPVIRHWIGRASYFLSFSEQGKTATVSVIFSQSVPMLITSLIGIVLYGGMTWYLLDRRLNLE